MAMNWSDDTCPENPEHGRALASPQGNPIGMFCPHADHHIRDTKFFWSFDEWEAAKTGKEVKRVRQVRNRRRPRKDKRS